MLLYNKYQGGVLTVAFPPANRMKAATTTQVIRQAFSIIYFWEFVCFNETTLYTKK